MANAPRAYWKGHLRLSLVSIAVELFPAVRSSSRLALHQIHRPTRKRVRYEKVVPDVGPVDADDIVKGYEIEDDTYVLLEPEELDAVRTESRSAIDLVQFVEHCEIDPLYFDRPYYLVPTGDVSTDGFVVIRDALRQSKRVGLGQMAMRGKESLVAVKACGDGLLLETLRYADELRDSAPYFDDVHGAKPTKEMLDLAKELIERKTAPFKADAFKDHYSDALLDLIERKREHRTIRSPAEKGGSRSAGNVIDLMDALKKSVAGGKVRKPAVRGKAPAAKQVKAKRRAKAG